VGPSASLGFGDRPRRLDRPGQEAGPEPLNIYPDRPEGLAAVRGRLCASAFDWSGPPLIACRGNSTPDRLSYAREDLRLLPTQPTSATSVAEMSRSPGSSVVALDPPTTWQPTPRGLTRCRRTPGLTPSQRMLSIAACFAQEVPQIHVSERIFIVSYEAVGGLSYRTKRSCLHIHRRSCLTTRRWRRASP